MELTDYRKGMMGALAAILLSPLLISSAAAQPVFTNYVLVDLGTLGGSESGAWAIDETGNVVGWAKTAQGSTHAFLSCEKCKISDLGTLPHGTDSYATSISANGSYIAGYSDIRIAHGIDGHLFEEHIQGFLREEGSMRALGGLFCFCHPGKRELYSQAYGVNDQGQTVGYSRNIARGADNAFIKRPGHSEMEVVHVGVYPVVSKAFGINNRTQVVGEYIDVINGEEDRVAFLWENGHHLDLHNLPGHSASTAVAINENGHAVGWSGNTDYSSTAAALWTSQLATALGTLDGDSVSRALDINDAGEVVGWSGDGASSRAFLWKEGLMMDLNSFLHKNSQWILLEARAINDAGMIAGTGIHRGETRAFLLKPKVRGNSENRGRGNGRS